MSEFQLYLRVGFDHIANLAGFDHILFIAALAIPYTIGNWRALAVLVTAFTMGHSITLALATLRIVSVPSKAVELLIPVTIVIASLLAFRDARRLAGRSVAIPEAARAASTPRSRYALAAVFGLVHGLGFSTYLRSLLGSEESIALPLFAFNVGLELGQLLILSVLLLFGALVVLVGVRRRWYMMTMACATAAFALLLLAARVWPGALPIPV